MSAVSTNETVLVFKIAKLVTTQTRNRSRGKLPFVELASDVAAPICGLLSLVDAMLYDRSTFV